MVSHVDGLWVLIGVWGRCGFLVSLVLLVFIFLRAVHDVLPVSSMSVQCLLAGLLLFVFRLILVLVGGPFVFEFITSLLFLVVFCCYLIGLFYISTSYEDTSVACEFLITSCLLCKYAGCICKLSGLSICWVIVFVWLSGVSSSFGSDIDAHQ